MAEAMFRAAYGDQCELFSAGVDPWDDLHPMALKLMAEDGLDMTGHYPKHVNDYLNQSFDFVVTIGDRAENETGDFPADTRRIHWPIDDPADADDTPDSEKVFRYTRQAILDEFPSLLDRVNSWDDTSGKSFRPGISTCLFRFEDFNPGNQDNLYAFRPCEHVPVLKQAGFDSIELCCYIDCDFPWKDDSAITELRNVAIDNDISIWAVHTPELQLNDETENLSQKLDILKRFVDISQELKSGVLVLHFFPDPEKQYDQVPDLLCTLDEMIRQTPVTFCLETLQQNNKNQKLMELFNHLNTCSFGAVVDTGHNFIAGDLYGQIEGLGNKVKELHLHDNDGQGDQHQIPGKGRIDWGKVVAELKTIDFKGPLMLEIDEKVNSTTLVSTLKQGRECIDYLNSL